MVAETTDGKEAAAAVRRSRERLEAARAREPRAHGVMARLRAHLETNHFGERLDRDFKEHQSP